ncbi:TrkH family potassium uptake protein [bacterium]|nr:TrkH family potassium uptake protein [bacterium]
MMLGAGMVFTVIVAFIFADGDQWGITLSMAITLVLGFSMWKFLPGEMDLTARDGFAAVTFGWLGMSIVGALPYLFTGAIPCVTDALFESASGFTTTGASILTDIESLPHGILFWRSFTHWIGGMGIIVFSIAILPFLGVGGMQMFKAEAPGPTADKLTPRIRGTAEILWGVYVLVSAAQAALLMFGGMDWFDSLCHTFGTVATGGFSTKNTSIAFYQSPYIHYVITVFMFIAGINFSLHFWAIRGRPGKYLESPEFKFYALMIGISVVILSALNLFRGQPFEPAFRDAAFQTCAIATTTGYATADFELWQPLAQVWLVSLMLIGGMAGSTGGGMKTARAMILLRQARVELHKMVHPETIYPIRIGRKSVSNEIVQNILAFFQLYVMIAIFATLFMAALGLDLVTSLTSVIACMSNIGPGLGEVGPTDNYAAIPMVGKWMLTFLMIVGRLEIYTVFVLLTKTYWSR